MSGEGPGDPLKGPPGPVLRPSPGGEGFRGQAETVLPVMNWSGARVGHLPGLPAG
jgi:hypothetical protein